MPHDLDAAKAMDSKGTIEAGSTGHPATAAAATSKRRSDRHASAAGAGATAGAAAGAQTQNVQLSKKLSWLLRHGADKEGLKLGRGGYACLGDVVCPFPFPLLHLAFLSLYLLLACFLCLTAADAQQKYR